MNCQFSFILLILLLYKLFCNVLLRRNNFIGSFRLYTKHKEQSSFTTLRSGSRCESLRKSTMIHEKWQFLKTNYLLTYLVATRIEWNLNDSLFRQRLKRWRCNMQRSGSVQCTVHYFLKLSRLEAEHLALNCRTLHTLCTVSNMYRFDF